MILHTINKPSALSLCRHLISNEDLVVLLEEGVYLGEESLPGKVHAIMADLVARGMDSKLAPEITRINYSDFVALATEADKVCSWF